MANGVADNAIGAILEIPQPALDKIYEAEKAIKQLGATSAETANAVKNHWGTIAPHGIDTFISKLREAQEAMKGFSTVNVTLNTSAAVQAGEQLSAQMQRTSSDVSQAAQTMASSWNDLSKVKLTGFDIKAYGNNLTEVQAKLQTLKDNFKNKLFGEGGEQRMANEIRQIEEWIRLYKQASEEKDRALGKIQKAEQTKVDNAYLSEQKRLLADLLNLRKQINEQSTKVQSGRITGGSNIKQEESDLRRLFERYQEVYRALQQVNSEKGKDISKAAQAQAEVNAEKYKTDVLKQQIDYRQKLNAEIIRANELTAQGQQGKTRLGSGEEAAIQRQLNSDYKNQIKILREIGEIRANAAEKSRNITEQERTLLLSLGQRYKLYADDIKRVASAYTTMGEAAAKNFAADRSEQLARNAIMLADAQRKAAEAAQKHGLALRDTSGVESQMQRVLSLITAEENKLNNAAEAVRRAKEAFDSFKTANPTFNIAEAENQLQRLSAEIDALKQKAATQGALKGAVTMGQVDTKVKEYQALETKLITVRDLAQKLAFAEDDLKNAQSGQSAAIQKLRSDYQQLENELRRVQSANASINAEIGKGSTVKSLSAEYANLTKRLQEVNAAMSKFEAAGGSTSSTAFSALQQEYAAIMARRKEIEKMDIAEVNQYRQQMAQQAYQAELSAFVQMEAQKKAAALQTAQEESEARRRALQTYLQSYQGAMQQAEKVMAGRGGTSMFSTNIENIKRAINDLKAASGNLNLLNPSDVTKAEQLKRKIAELEALLKKYKAAATPDKPVINPQDAINAARNASTLHELERAYKDLKAAMANTSTQSPMWNQMSAQLQKTGTKIEQIKRKMDEFNQQAKTTGSIIGALKNQIAAAFSVQAITGFIRKMVETRAQFELQRVALGAILQDRDEANKVFTQVQNMALESPFSIMQLERATKQIAAFGFEGKKLLPTMKMLADMSAGLGVEIDRLVLVMGHLKARNFLEGTMVRQFTNAGFNVLGELAKYYSEIEDKMVSVGEVQERVKKKMVSFEDVEEVLKRVTSAGGMFYDMQKKQSDSIWGQMQRITDAYDLMLNEIGQGNEGWIKWGLTAIRTLINSWRDLAPYIKGAATAMAVWGIKAVVLGTATSLMPKLISGFQTLRLAIMDVTAAQKTLNATQAANVWGALAAIIIGVGMAIYEVCTATSKLDEEMQRIGQDTVNSLNESIVTFVQLANTISDMHSTFTERNEALNEMKRIYADILPQEQLEIDYIQSLNGNYADLTKTIQEYYQNKEYQQKMEAIQGSEEAQKLTKEWENTLTEMNNAGAFMLKLSKSQIKSWADTFSKELMSGKIAASADAIEAELQKKLGAKNIAGYKTEVYGRADIADILDAYGNLVEIQGDIALETTNAENAIESYNDSLKHLDLSQLLQNKKTLQEQVEFLQNTLKNEQQRAVAYNIDPEESIRVKDVMEQLESVQKQIKAVDNAEREWLANQFNKAVEERTQEFENQIKAYWEAKNALEKLTKQGVDSGKEWDNQTSAMNKAKESADILAETYGVKLNWEMINSARTSIELRDELDTLAVEAFPKVAAKAMESLNSVRKYLLSTEGAVYKFLKNLLDVVPENLRSAIPGFANILDTVDKGLAITEEQLNELGNAAGKTNDSTAKAGANIDKMISDKAIERADQFGANVYDLDKVIRDTDKGAEQMAKDLRSSAKSWDETVKSYQTSTDKALWLSTRNMTEEQITLMEKNSKAAKALATDLAGVDEKSKSKGRKGDDPIKKLWENRLDALKKYYDAAEKARKHFDESETSKTQKSSFQNLWDSLGMNNMQGLSLSDLSAKGFDPKKLKDDYVGALNELLKFVPAKYTELRNKIQETIASESIEIKFKIKEGEEDELKKQIEDMFANVELTKELQKANISVDFTYMVGGQPMTLDDAARALTKLRKQFGGEKAAEEVLKILNDADKKLQDEILKQQKERLKNYEKYIATMYSDRAKAMIKSYDTMKQMETDFVNYIDKLNDKKKSAEVSGDTAGVARFSEQIETAKRQQAEATESIRKDLEKTLNSLDWESFKGSDIFTQMYKDVETLSKKGIDALLVQLETMRTKLQNASDVDPKAIREVTQYMEKLNDAKLQFSPYESFRKALAVAKELKEEYGSLGEAQKQLAELNATVMSDEQIVSDFETIISLIDKEKTLKEDDVRLTEQQRTLYSGYKNDLQGGLKAAREKLNTDKADATALSSQLDAASRAKKAYEVNVNRAQMWKEKVDQITDSCFEIADALGAEVDEEWKNLAKSIIDATFQGIMLQLQLEMLKVAAEEMGVAMNSALGVIGWIATALQVVASLLTAIFAAKDKSLQKKIDKIQERVDSLSTAFEGLEKSIDKAFSVAKTNQYTESALDNLEEQKAAYEEMIRLEDAKKKTDKDKIKDYKDKLRELREAEEEILEKRREKYGSTNDVWGEANEWVDAWLDAYKEAGTGIDALNESWDEFYENLVKKQAVSKVLGSRMDSYIQRINDAIDANMDEYGYVNAFKAIGEEFKSEFGDINQKLIEFFKYAGIGGAGEYVLSDLQQGIQNITEPQAAAIEAYLNSMRFAVYRHTEQLDALIESISLQYNSSENPILLELKGIRMVLDSIDSRLGSVISRNAGSGGSFIRINA